MPRQIYRIGQDIYNAATNARIGATDWSQNWSGQSDVQDLGQRTQNIPASPVSNLASNQPNIYDTSSLANTNVNIPPQTTNRYDNARNVLDSSISSTSNSLSSFLSQFDSYTKPAETERTGLVSKMNTAIDKLVGRGKRTQELMTEQQLPQNYEQLKALNLQIAEKKAAYDKSIQAIEGKNIPMPFITGQQAQVQKMANIELGNMATLAQALQGNIELSRQMVNDTVNLEYADTEQEIENLQYQLTLNEQNMTAAEKKRAEALSIALTERQAQLDAEKQEKIDIKNVAIEAAKNGAPTDTAQRMMNAKTLQEAMGIGGNFLQAPKDSNVEWGVIGQHYDENTGTMVNDYGFINKDTMTTTGSTPSYANYTNSQNVVAGSGDSYDITSYATDPNHEAAVQSILDNIGKFNNESDLTNYIKKVAPNSPITAEMVKNTSQKYGVSWEMLIAMMQQDSSLGTAGKGARTYNPGNVGNDDSGNIRNYGSWQAGVDAVGNWLNNHRVSTIETQVSPNVKTWADSINSGKATLSDAQKVLNKKQQTELMAELSKVTPEASELDKKIAMSIQSLNDMYNSGNRAAIGKSSAFNYWDWMAIPGTKTKEFIIQYNNLKSLLSLENVKYLKGQGQVSDAERRLLADAASNLNRFSSEETFKKNLDDLMSQFEKITGYKLGSTGNSWTSPSGNSYNLPN